MAFAKLIPFCNLLFWLYNVYVIKVVCKGDKTNIKMLYSFLAILIICSMLFTGAPIALATGVYPDTNEDGDITKNKNIR